MNKLYSVHDHWTNINKKNDVDIESIDGVITGIKVNGEDYGGVTWNQVFTGDVVTSGEAAPFSGTINANLSGSDTIMMFYNDGKYILPKQVTDDGIFYGATPGANPSDIDFSEIPFLIKVSEVNTALYTQSPGPQNITIFEPASGGGGSSDFSTAEVTVIQEDESLRGFLLPSISNDTFELQEYQSGIHTVPLYRGSLFIMASANIGIIESVSGDIERLSEGKRSYYRIYGDCTITIS